MHCRICRSSRIHSLALNDARMIHASLLLKKKREVHKRGLGTAVECMVTSKDMRSVQYLWFEGCQTKRRSCMTVYVDRVHQINCIVLGELNRRLGAQGSAVVLPCTRRKDMENRTSRCWRVHGVVVTHLAYLLHWKLLKVVGSNPAAPSPFMGQPFPAWLVDNFAKGRRKPG